MNGKIWHDIFLEELYKKYPQKSGLTEALMDLLSIEREATLRRLRRNVAFPADEVMKIAATWNISVDEIIGTSYQKILFDTKIIDYVNPSKEDLLQLQRENQWYDTLKGISDLEHLQVCNKIPRSLSSGFLYLSKFQLLGWMHQHGSRDIVPFSQIVLSSEITKAMEEYHQNAKNIHITNYIWDEMLFHYLVRNIQYFHSIELISNEEKELIKTDLYNLLEYMSKVAANGCWSETGNVVNLYISNISIEANYSYFFSESKNVKMSTIQAFIKSEVCTENPVMIENFRNWMPLKKRSSVLISNADEKRRIDFFRAQFKLADEL